MREKAIARWERWHAKRGVLNVSCLLKFLPVVSGAGLLCRVICPACQASDEMEAKQTSKCSKMHGWVIEPAWRIWLGKNQSGKDSQDSYTARYKIITRATDSEVKATGDKLTPFVGILKYEEDLQQSRHYVELAKQGPFASEREVVITEIFRYANGKWLY